MNHAFRPTITGLSMLGPRVICKRFGGIQGPLFDVAVGNKCFRVGELTKKLLMSGTPLEDLDLSWEVNPDEENDND